MNKKYKVSCIIPNYNYGSRVINAVESVKKSAHYAGLSQDDVNIVVVDDCSTDDSILNLTCKYQLIEKQRDDGYILYTDKNLSLISLTQNGGPARARNVGIQYVWDKTDVYFMLDSDDEIYENKILECLYEFKLDDVNIGVIYNDFVAESEDGSYIHEYFYPFSKKKMLQQCIANGNCMISKRALEACGLYDESMRTAEDWDLWIRISQKFMFVHIAKELQKHYIHSNNSTNTVDPKVWQENWAKIYHRYQNAK